MTTSNINAGAVDYQALFSGGFDPFDFSSLYQNIDNTPKPYTVDTSQANQGANGAADLLGKISRQQWEHYKDLYLQPIETAMGEIGNEQVMSDQIAKAEDKVNQGYANITRDAFDSMRAYGTQLSGDQMDSFNRKQRFSRDKALIGARNITRESKYNRDMALIGGSAGGLSSLKEE